MELAQAEAAQFSAVLWVLLVLDPAAAYPRCNPEQKRVVRAASIHGMARMAAYMACTYKAYLGEGLGPLEGAVQWLGWGRARGLDARASGWMAESQLSAAAADAAAASSPLSLAVHVLTKLKIPHPTNWQARPTNLPHPPPTLSFPPTASADQAQDPAPGQGHWRGHHEAEHARHAGPHPGRVQRQPQACGARGALPPGRSAGGASCACCSLCSCVVVAAAPAIAATTVAGCCCCM